MEVVDMCRTSCRGVVANLVNNRVEEIGDSTICWGPLGQYVANCLI
jgi:hypothetical protein